jgi:hypothetical protein
MVRKVRFAVIQFTLTPSGCTLIRKTAISARDLPRDVFVVVYGVDYQKVDRASKRHVWGNSCFPFGHFPFELEELPTGPELPNGKGLDWVCRLVLCTWGRRHPRESQNLCVLSATLRDSS